LLLLAILNQSRNYKIARSELLRRNSSPGGSREDKDAKVEAVLKSEKLSSEVFELRRRIGSASVESDKFPPAPSKSRLGTPAKGRAGTPAKPVTPGREIQKKNPIVETLRGYDDELTSISRIENKIAKFEDFLEKMRTDLYGSLDALTEKVIKTKEVVDPPKRGVPKIISDIQLVPPRTTQSQHQRSEAQYESEPFSDLDTWTEVIGRKKRRQRR